jgi:acylphosphatase
MEDFRAFKAMVFGRVQGIGFRYSARVEAKRLGLSGWVTNRPDSSVEVVCEGTKGQCELFETWLRKGPSGAHISHLELRYTPYRGIYNSFTIEY